MTLKPFWNPAWGQMPVGGLMSGTGKNLEAAVELERSFSAKGDEPPFKIAVIYTNKPKTSRAHEIGGKYGIPILGNDYRELCNERGVPMT
ncbi:hypothetical protein HYV81_02890 [Candidatus Woesearchaeota archaeon]|nr:hypothetical protein [Candidatus Woesearchaeota archaeon]